MKKVVRGKRSVIITFIFPVDWLPSSRFKITHFLSFNVASSETACFARKATLTIGFLGGCFEIFIFLSSPELNIFAHPRRFAWSPDQMFCPSSDPCASPCTRLHCKPTVPPVQPTLMLQIVITTEWLGGDSFFPWNIIRIWRLIHGDHSLSKII